LKAFIYLVHNHSLVFVHNCSAEALMRFLAIAFLCFTISMLAQVKSNTPTIAEAEEFMKKTEERLADLEVKVN